MNKFHHNQKVRLTKEAAATQDERQLGMLRLQEICKVAVPIPDIRLDPNLIYTVDFQDGNALILKGDHPLPTYLARHFELANEPLNHETGD